MRWKALALAMASTFLTAQHQAQDDYHLYTIERDSVVVQESPLRMYHVRTDSAYHPSTALQEDTPRSIRTLAQAYAATWKAYGQLYTDPTGNTQSLEERLRGIGMRHEDFDITADSTLYRRVREAFESK